MNYSAELEKIVNELKAQKVSVSKMEKGSGLSNGMIGKALKGTYVFSQKQFGAVKAFYESFQTTSGLNNDYPSGMALQFGEGAGVSAATSDVVVNLMNNQIKSQIENTFVEDGKALAKAVEDINSDKKTTFEGLWQQGDQSGSPVQKKAVLSELIQIEGVTTGDKVAPPLKFKPVVGIPLEIADIPIGEWKLVEKPWVTEIEAYCDKNGIIPQDLIECHQNSLKSPRRASLKDIMDTKAKEGDSSKYDLRKIKMGF